MMRAATSLATSSVPSQCRVLGGPGTEGAPEKQGFDHFYGYLCQRVAHNYYPTHLWRNHDVDVLHNNDYFRAHQRIEEPMHDRVVLLVHRPFLELPLQ